jgi:hypothetical protein
LHNASSPRMRRRAHMNRTGESAVGRHAARPRRASFLAGPIATAGHSVRSALRFHRRIQVRPRCGPQTSIVRRLAAAPISPPCRRLYRWSRLPPPNCPNRKKMGRAELGCRSLKGVPRNPFSRVSSWCFLSRYASSVSMAAFDRPSRHALTSRQGIGSSGGNTKVRERWEMHR